MAIKKLYSTDPVEFQRERDVLIALGSQEYQGSHIIDLLATYPQKGKYHLIFHYADASLPKCWEDRPIPNFDRETVLWSVAQMAGISCALSQIHELARSDQLLVDGNAQIQAQNGGVKYGRHGDIRPHNVLWFQEKPGVDCGKNGVLMVADFGLARLHGQNSRSNAHADTVIAAPTYKAPECKVGKYISRAYDIWCLGCLYLQFITWLLMGWEAIDLFSESRSILSGGIEEDNFFTVTEVLGEPQAEVRHSVVSWVDNLHQHEKCSELIHELLDLIMKQLLIVDPKARVSASRLYQETNTLLKKSERSAHYLLEPSPLAPEFNKRTSRLASTTSHQNIGDAGFCCFTSRN